MYLELGAANFNTTECCTSGSHHVSALQFNQIRTAHKFVFGFTIYVRHYSYPKKFACPTLVNITCV